MIRAIVCCSDYMWRWRRCGWKVGGEYEESRINKAHIRWGGWRDIRGRGCMWMPYLFRQYVFYAFNLYINSVASCLCLPNNGGQWKLVRVIERSTIERRRYPPSCRWHKQPSQTQIMVHYYLGVKSREIVRRCKGLFVYTNYFKLQIIPSLGTWLDLAVPINLLYHYLLTFF